MFKQLLFVVSIVAAQASTAQNLPPVPTEKSAEYVFSVHVCRRVEKVEDAFHPCVTTATSRLASQTGDTASTSNFRQVTYLASSPAGPARSAEHVATAPALSPQAVKVGYELSLKPLYESDGLAYVQYDLSAAQIARWVAVEGEGVAIRLHVPELQETKLSGTDKVRPGQSFRIDRSGYVFEVRLLSAAPPTSY
ncbi:MULTISPECIES: hypothetical protein [unclassified Variovorax]|uniref:hypothetical protein n=1 Tax=unclassified Variovorax TaxID=663243 RepID=UPI0008391307|nr:MULTISPECIES: hypothetical protein [unclassified Variovorax]PNG50105.1 hypothetical protein CHC06_05728 [Variovorax sp. B2]PNG50977.1 hypothetical protein CHC07_05633 [Variovorax sp. B4]VTU41850.1 hypothetical protein SRS16P1_00142 [Variovorax sp. SRS16]VTU41890.1 hypothetical protein E5P1_00142 [Variovorax sp. PBL-E5]VTU44567.1 hypothetical protein H6P1_00792 [Variovorax sp. PBL-H6]